MEKELVIKILRYYKDIDKYIQHLKRMIQDNIIKHKIMPEHICEEQKEYAERINSLIHLKKEIRNELNLLEPKLNIVVSEYYIRNRQWVQIGMNIHYSVSGCKRLKNKALKILGERFESNLYIKKYYSQIQL